MSLDVYLYQKTEVAATIEEKIFVRIDGETREVTEEEYAELFPGRVPIVIDVENFRDTNCVYSRNITHNLNTMADKAGIYEALWRPEEIGITKASQLIEPLRAGLVLLKSDPEHFKAFNPSNGWGNYDGLIDFVKSYLAACEEYPDADVSASR